MLWRIVFAIFVAGCLGGFVNALLAGELKLPKLDAEAGVYHPGWVGNVIVGGVAALVFWGLYGPLASATILGTSEGPAPTTLMRVSELFGALLSGVGGGRVLSAEIDKRHLQKENDALDKTKVLLTASVQQLASRV